MPLRRSLIPLAVLAIPATAFALSSGNGNAGQTQGTASMPQSSVPKFKQADTNHDGKIEWKEAKAAGVPKKLFQRDDFDHSGSLNKNEWMFVRLDMTNFKAPASGTGG